LCGGNATAVWFVGAPRQGLASLKLDEMVWKMQSRPAPTVIVTLKKASINLVAKMH